MLTSVSSFDASGNSKTLRPFCRRYSLMPSMDGPAVIPAGNAGVMGADCASVTDVVPSSDRANASSQARASGWRKAGKRESSEAK